jgi:hypothetical protein
MRLVRRDRAKSACGTLAFIVALGAALGSASPARAQGTGAGSSTAKVAAETLFDEGRRLMSDGKAVEACPKFAESQRLDPSPATLLNLASCYERTDRPATAWATYRAGASAASAAGRQDLVATAQRHADALFPSLPRLSLNVPSPADGMAVALDGVSVGRAEWGIAVPVDPGEHTVDASAPHFKPWSTKLAVGKEATTIAVSVPALDAAPPEPAPAMPPPAPAVLAPASSSSLPPSAGALPPDSGSNGSTQRLAAVVIGGAGIVSAGVGAGFAVSAKSQYNSSLANCSGTPPDVCTQPGFDQRNSAINAGNVATFLIAAGGVAVAGGIVLWLTAPSASHPQAASLALVPAPGGGMLRGTW